MISTGNYITKVTDFSCIAPFWCVEASYECVQMVWARADRASERKKLAERVRRKFLN